MCWRAGLETTAWRGFADRLLKVAGIAASRAADPALAAQAAACLAQPADADLTVRSSVHPRVWRGRAAAIDATQLARVVRALTVDLGDGNLMAAHCDLAAIVPHYQPSRQALASALMGGLPTHRVTIGRRRVSPVALWPPSALPLAVAVGR